MPFLSSLRHDRRGKTVVFGAKKSVLFRGTSGQARFRLQPALNSRGMAMTVERISAVTFRVSNMQASVQFYRDVLGMEMLYGGERSTFSSLRAGNADSAILNLELGEAATRWGRLIFYVANVDGVRAFWMYCGHGQMARLVPNPITSAPHRRLTPNAAPQLLAPDVESLLASRQPALQSQRGHRLCWSYRGFV